MIERIGDFLMNTPWWDPSIIAVLVIVGAFVGFVNTVAGMATVISYGLFMAMGMPINIANATSRIGVMLQFSTNSFIYKKEGLLDVGLATRVGVPVALGAFFGAEMASMLPPQVMEIASGVLLPLIVILLIIDKDKVMKRFDLHYTPQMTLWKYLLFFILGIYGGFTHAGIGILVILSSFFFLGQDLTHANAIKQLTTVIYTPVALVIFAIHGQINWPVALIYAVGNVIGGVVASKVAIRWGEKFIKVAVIVVVLIMSAYLLWKQF
ncbi:MAG: sulfite exporter TauE/SafE family protein [Bacteroidales bacterium]|nr:sulfite exporter TauE/SafE family protein [Bacteroidales bacterium]